MGIRRYEGYEEYESLPEKPDTFFIGIRGYRDTRPSVGVQDENQRLGGPSSLKTMGIRGYEGYEGYELLPEKPDTFFHRNTRIQGYQTLCRGYRTKIRA